MYLPASVFVVRVRVRTNFIKNYLPVFNYLDSSIKGV
jgi:hypothetical protein